jgi:hypothetical protein
MKEKVISKLTMTSKLYKKCLKTKIDKKRSQMPDLEISIESGMEPTSNKLANMKNRDMKIKSPEGLSAQTFHDL